MKASNSALLFALALGLTVTTHTSKSLASAPTPSVQADTSEDDDSYSQVSNSDDSDMITQQPEPGFHANSGPARQPASDPKGFGNISGNGSGNGSGNMQSGTTTGAPEDSTPAEYVAPSKEAQPYHSSSYNSPGTSAGSSADLHSNGAGQISAANPATDTRVRGPLTNFSANAGVGGGFGLDNGGVMWGVGADYKFRWAGLPDRWAAKGLADVNFADGTDSSKFLNLGVGANYYLGDYMGTDMTRSFGTADLSVANATDGKTSHSATSAALGVGFGYAIARTTQADIDVLIHYSVLLDTLDGSVPSVLSARLGFAF